MEKMDFPVFAVGYLPDIQVLLVAGGGGSTKSGIPNGLAAYAVDDPDWSMRRIGFLSTGSKAVMSLAVHPRECSAVLGVGERCWLVNVDWDRKASSRPKEECFLGLTKALRSDYSSDALPEEERGYQKCCKFDASGLLLATGGSDGVGRLWEYPTLAALETFTASPTDKEDSPDYGAVQSVDILDDYLLVTRERRVLLYDFDNGTTALSNVGLEALQLPSTAFRCGCFATPERIVLTSEDSVVMLDLGLQPVHAVRLKKRRVTCVHGVNSQDRQSAWYGLVVAGCHDGSVVLLQATASKLRIMRIFDQVHPFAVSSVHATSSSSAIGRPGTLMVATGSVGGTVALVGYRAASLNRSFVLLMLLLIMAVLIGYLVQQWLYL